MAERGTGGKQIPSDFVGLPFLPWATCCQNSFNWERNELSYVKEKKWGGGVTPMDPMD